MSTAAAALTATAEIDIATVDAVNLNHGGGGGIGCSHCGCRCRGMIDNDELLQKQRQQEEDLQAAVEITSLFEDFMQFGSVGLHIVDDSGTILWANKAELDLLGYREDEYIGKPIMQFHADQSCVQEILTTLLAGQRVENYIAPILCRDGHVEYVQINSSMRQVDGKCVTTRCFSACVTDRVLREQAQLQAMAKEKEAQLIQEQAKRKTEFLRSLCHELRNPLNGISGNLDLLLCELKELQCELQDAFDAVKQAQKDHQGVTAAHAPTTKYELREHGLEAAAKTPAPVTPATGSKPVLLLEGDTTSTTGTNKRKLPQDPTTTTTTTRKTQQRLADALDFAKSAQLAAEHQMLVINDTLSLSRLESTKGQLDFSPKPVNVPSLIQSVTAILGVKAQEKKVRLQVKMIQEASLQVRTDPVWFKQILINLISNAIKFVDSERGQVVVKVQQKKYPQKQNRLQQVALEVAVQDNGIGMTPEEQAKLFGVFAQANEKISAQFGGSGLGLHIVKQLLDHVGGTIGVESQKGVGTTFSFCLPCGPPLAPKELAKLSEEPKCGDRDNKNKNKKPRLSSSSTSSNQASSSAQPAPGDAGKKESIKVLVVDDSHINLKILSNFLRKRGYAHELAENGQIALEKFQQSNFDIILTDVQMPKMNGLEMTRNIRQHEEKQLPVKPPVPIIGISGNVLPEDAASARQVGMNEYVGKPYRFADLEALMREHLELS